MKLPMVRKVLKNLSKGAYDLCLCDIKMPKMDGMEVLEKAKEAEYAAPISL